MAVDEEEAEAAPAFERERRAKQNRAVAAKNQREFTDVQYASHRIGELRTPLSNGARIEGSGFGIAVWIVWWWLDTSCISCVYAVRETVLEERPCRVIIESAPAAEEGGEA